MSAKPNDVHEQLRNDLDHLSDEELFTKYKGSRDQAIKLYEMMSGRKYVPGAAEPSAYQPELQFKFDAKAILAKQNSTSSLYSQSSSDPYFKEKVHKSYNLETWQSKVGKFFRANWLIFTFTAMFFIALFLNELKNKIFINVYLITIAVLVAGYFIVRWVNKTTDTVFARDREEASGKKKCPHCGGTMTLTKTFNIQTYFDWRCSSCGHQDYYSREGRW